MCSVWIRVDNWIVIYIIFWRATTTKVLKSVNLRLKSVIALKYTINNQVEKNIFLQKYVAIFVASWHNLAHLAR